MWRVSSTWKFVLAGLVVLLAGAACEAQLPAGAVLTPPTTAPELTAVPTPTRVPLAPTARNLVIAIPEEPSSLDPQVDISPSTLDITRNIYDTLVRFDERGNLQPGLAERWHSTQDGRGWFFYLQRDRHFQDGREVSGEDVAFSLQRLIDPETASLRAKDYAAIDTVSVSNTYTITIRLKEPDFALPVELAADWAAIVPEEAADNLSAQPMGSGEFALDEWVPGDFISLRRVGAPADAAAPDELVFRVIQDDAGRLAALKAGEVDLALRIPPTYTVDLKSDPDVTLVQMPANQVKVVSFNEAQPPLNDVRVRRALCDAIDRKALVQSVWQGTAIPAGGELSPALPYSVDTSAADNFDPTQARALLQEAGLTSGISLTITIPRDEEYRRVAEAVVDQWATVGVQAQIQQLDWTVFLNQVYFAREYAVTVMTHVGRFDPALAFARYVTGGPRNYVGYSNPTYDQLVRAALGATADRRAEVLAALQRTLTEDAVVAYLAAPLTTAAARSNIKGYRMSPFGGSDLRQVRKD